MTETGRRLRHLGASHVRARRGALFLLAGGIVLAIAALGMRLAPLPAPIVGAWAAMLVVVALAVWQGIRARRGTSPEVLGRLAEQAGAGRSGSVVGVLPSRRATTSPDLLALADARAARFVTQVGPRVDRVLEGETRRRIVIGAVAAVVGALVFIATSPSPGRAAFWHPFRALADANAPVRLEIDRDTVRRGDRVQVTVRVPGALHATLWTRAPGEPWHPEPLTLDQSGQVVRTLGPLGADLYVKASSGSRNSVERRIVLARAAFIASLNVIARFPAYLSRDEQPLVPGSDTILIPEGTDIVTTGELSVPATDAAWQRAGAESGARLSTRGTHFSGRFTPHSSGRWQLAIAPASGAPLEGDIPELALRVVPDSAPVVAVPVPGRDTMLPITMRQPLVVDVRDDHGIARVAIVSWRASRSGKVGEALRQPLDAQAVGDRALIQGELAGDRRGLLPGDTLKFRVEAWDNAPTPHKGQSPDYALRLPGLEDLRAAARAQTHDVAQAADSLVAAQNALSDQTRDLAEQRMRAETGGSREGQSPLRPNPQSQPGSLPFEASERAAAIERQQAELQARAHQLSQQLDQVARAAQAAGITDTAFQARLAEVQNLLQRALTPELEERLKDLQNALARLDPEATRDALQRLAEAQQQLREELEQSRELFRRAAIEGDLASLAADAEDLHQHQAEWNQSDARRLDTAAAAREAALAARAESLAHGIEKTAADLARASSDSANQAPLDGAHTAAEQAHSAMNRAASAAQGGVRQSSAAMSAGQQAESSLATIPEELREQRDSLARAWRQETLDALDRALAETADLAARQQDIADALHTGNSGPAVRSQQASVQEGTQLVAKEIRTAAGRHALVSPQLERALGFAQHQMQATGEQLGEADPSGNGAEGAATLADQSVDALNATAFALARSRGDVSGAKSGTGFSEAMEELAKLAQQQGGMNGETEGLLPLQAAGGQAVQERLQAIAREQRALANQLDRMRAEGAGDQAGAMAREARDIAAQLEAGRLDPLTIRRQSLLYHHLLDAGRSLTGPEPDEKKDRVSQAASIDSVHIPPELLRGATGAGPRVRYPTWDELRGLTPEQRRLVLEYFRRLNTPARAETGPGGTH